MKNKGFTLVELLGVITILGIIALVSFSALDSINKNDKEKAYEAQVNGILEAAISYMPTSENPAHQLPLEEKKEGCISLAELSEEGVLSSSLKNPRTEENYDMGKTKVCFQKIKANDRTTIEGDKKKGTFAYDGNYIYYLIEE